MRANGSRIFLNLHESPMMIERALGAYEFWTFQLLRKIMRPGMIAIDVGANKGDYSLLFAHLIGDNGRVLSFEPVPDNLEWFHKSIAANGYHSIEIFDTALSSEAGEHAFYLGRKSGWGSLIPGRKGVHSENPLTVEMATLDGVLTSQNIEDVDVVKIDVEGAELAVLQGAIELLRKSRRVNLIVDFDAGSDPQRNALRELLLDNGFQVFAIAAGALRPISQLSHSTRTIYAVKEVPATVKPWLP
jgi:FkbM family methyltransferase